MPHMSYHQARGRWLEAPKAGYSLITAVPRKVDISSYVHTECRHGSGSLIAYTRYVGGEFRSGADGRFMNERLKLLVTPNFLNHFKPDWIKTSQSVSVKRFMIIVAEICFT